MVASTARSRNKNIEAIYPLTPLQQGMLFHTLLASETGVYVEQLGCRLRGELDVVALKRAWQRVFERHSVLRTAFIWEELEQPLQVVGRKVNLPLEQQDWRELSHDAQKQRLETLLQEDRRMGYKLSKSPLMRLKLIRLATDVYQFVLSYHHLLLDGWSVPILLKEVFSFYEGFRRGQDLQLKQPRPYMDYIRWLRQQDGTKAEGFWRETLKGFVSPTPLGEKQFPAKLTSQDEAYSDEEMHLSPTLTASLQSLARQHQLTLSTLLQGAWVVLLSCYSGQHDVLFGVTTSGRPATLTGAEAMVGLFINTLPMRVEVAPRKDVLTWLKGLQHELVEMRQYEHNALIQIHGWSEVPRGVPLFESILVFENYPVEESLPEQIGSLRIEDIHSFEQTNYALTLTVTPGAQMSLRLHYDCRKFGAATIHRMLGHLQSMLEGMVANPEQRLTRLPLLTVAEEQQFAEWNRTKKDYPLEKCLHELFEAQVELTPDEVAVKFEDQHLTYRELGRRANQLANYLRKLGVGADVLVGICVERSLDLMVGLVGILKAGGAYLPLDPAYPKERLSFLLENSHGPVLLTQQRLLDALPEHSAVVVCLDADWPHIAHESGEKLTSVVRPANLAYVIYTSGSTGTPKGVMIEQRSMLNHLWIKVSTLQLTSQDVVAQTASQCFDISVWQMLAVLLVGGRVEIIPDEVAHDPWLLAERVEQAGVTVLESVPSFLRMLVRQAAGSEHTGEEAGGGAWGSLRLLLATGEALPPQLCRDWLELYPSIPLVNAYGPTECADDVSQAVISERPGEEVVQMPIGQSLANLQLYVLDREMRLVPVGCNGELYVGGVGVGRGYLHDGGRTAERFVPDPFGEQAGARLYCTGDVVRWSERGELEYLGRVDDQVKVRGYRIELGEIEAVLEGHERVSEAVVVVRENKSGGKRLVGYVVSRERQEVTGRELRRYVREQLPEYMVPAAIVGLKQLPLTSNGKVDRQRLMEMEVAAEEKEREEEYVGPRDEIEEALCGILREVLRIERASIYDNFFELGGDSILSIQVISRMRAAFHVNLPLRQLFEDPTVAGLAEAIKAAIRDGQDADTGSIQRVSREEELPMSFAQQRLWFLNQLNPHSPAYNIPAAVRLTGQLNVEVLEQTFNEIQRRHESLRTTFALLDGRPIQNISHAQPAELAVRDLSYLTEPQQQDEEMRRLASAEAQRTFDLTRGPLLRTTLLRLREEEHVLLMTMHHIISDGWSIGIFIREAAVLYKAYSLGEASPLPELPIQYADYAAWQRKWLSGELLQEQLAYWKEQLSGAPPLLELPTDHPRPAQHSFHGAELRFTLSSELEDSLNSFSQRHGVTLFMTMLAALKILLFKWTGQSDIVVGTVTANRNRVEVEPLIGCFMNFLALRSTLTGQESAKEMVEQVKARVLEAYGHQECPFEKVVEAVNPERRGNQNPLYNVAFLFQNFPRSAVLREGLEATIVPQEIKTALLDIRLVAEETLAGIELLCEYNTDLFEAETIQHFIATYHDFLELLCQHPEMEISCFHLSEELEARAGLRRWEQTIAITSTFTAEPLEKSLTFWMQQLDMPSRIEFAPYNQVFQQLLDPASRIAKNRQGVNVVLVRLEDWQRYGDRSEVSTASLSQAAEKIERNAQDLVRALKTATEHSAVPYLVCLCPASPAIVSDTVRSAFFQRIEELIESQLETVTGVHLVTTSELLTTYPVQTYDDPQGDKLGHIPYLPALFAALGTMIARKIYALKSAPYKVVVLDCDETLWDGICGEDGALGVNVDPPRHALQEFLVARHEDGMLICLCSKNNEEDVREVFKQHPEMPLSSGHIAGWRINWKSKSENIRSLATELQLGLNSFIVIDDNPVECAEIQAHCPEVLTLQLPELPGEIPKFLRHTWAFDHLKSTAEDRERNSFYQQNRERERVRNESLTFADFVATLSLEVQLLEMESHQVARVAQLTQRTNQFNNTGIRRSENEIKKLCQEDGFECLGVHVRDRFGEYGLVGVIIYANATDALNVDTFLLSCRVLGRGVEYEMLASLGDIAMARGLNRIGVRYLSTQRNQPALDFLQSVGSEPQQPGNGDGFFMFTSELVAGLDYNSALTQPKHSGDLPIEMSIPALTLPHALALSTEE